jgi:hypothetical protein
MLIICLKHHLGTVESCQSQPKESLVVVVSLLLSVYHQMSEAKTQSSGFCGVIMSVYAFVIARKLHSSRIPVAESLW